ncbi:MULTISPECIES: serine hydrolase domain-containing protein [unclassified Nocardioides]|uniref:serine hydrolase domain-containing protein n=1 Tax=unclassified Nocardioides TaxID=2615069 RepID=UPI000A7F3FC9|nr:MULTISPECIES: serine hydrolase domain-containing protein [unclassified Nocardioides]
MTEIDQLLSAAVEDKVIPFGVAMVTDRHGVLWSGVAGNRTPDVAATTDTLFRIFSMSKAIGAVAANILIDKQLLTLDTPVVDILDDFKNIQVLDGYGSNGPNLRDPRTPITVRHLLTNSAGFAYPGWSDRQSTFALLTDAPHPNSGLLDAIRGPLMFDPGEGMVYGYGFDWIGPLIEELDGRRVVEFCQAEIFDPLGMIDTMFEPDRAIDRLATGTLRTPDGSFTPFVVSPPAQPEVYGLGQALYGTAPDYIRFLRFFLNKGELDGRRLLSPEGFERMTTPQAGSLTMPVMKTTASVFSADANLCPESSKTWTTGFLTNTSDLEGRRRAGSLTWAGFLNTHYWADPTTGVAAVLMTQLLPFVDPEFMNLYDTFERTVYKTFAHTPGAMT